MSCLNFNFETQRTHALVWVVFSIRVESGTQYIASISEDFRNDQVVEDETNEER
jgi:hypothetical protein